MLRLGRSLLIDSYFGLCIRRRDVSWKDDGHAANLRSHRSSPNGAPPSLGGARSRRLLSASRSDKR